MKLIPNLRLISVLLCGTLLPCTVVASPTDEPQQAPSVKPQDRTRVSGDVTDPSGALVPNADIEASSSNGLLVQRIKADAVGRFTTELPEGTYAFKVSADGFAPYVTQIRVGRKALTLRAQLVILAAEASVQVNAASVELSTSEDANKNGIDLKGDELATLSDDDATFQQQLLALAGDDGSHLPQVYVDGFSTGKFPPKSAIREVKINQNPFSAAFDAMGLGRIEILTRPGTGSLHGGFDLYGNPSAFNSRNPFLRQAEPSYYRLHTVGHLSGPLGKKTSFFVSGDYYDQQNNAVINAQSVDNTGSIYSISEAVPDPTKTEQYSARLDRQWTDSNTFTARYELDRVSQENGGLTQSVLPSGASNSVLTTQTWQLRDTQFIGANLEADSGFQWIRARTVQNPLSSAPTVQVSGTVTAGGSPLQALNDHQDQLEFQENVAYQHKAHLLRFGGRYRFYRDANFSTTGFNGTYTFNSLTAYQASVLGTPSASQYQVTLGNSAFVATTGDFAAWAEDEWQLQKNLTLDVGVRFETQSGIPDHSDPSPHFGIAWAPFRSKQRQSLLVLRAGSGIYYDRFSIGNLVTTTRQGNPALQQTYTVDDPQFFSTTVPSPSASWTLTTYRISPDLRSEYEIDSSASAEISLGKRGSLAFTFLNKVQKHQWVSINANAPRVDGTRPFGNATGNIYEFVSGAEGLGNWFYIDPRIKITKSLTMSGHFNLKRQTADTFGPTYFASNSYDIHQDYGRSPSDRRYSASVSLSDTLKWGIRMACFLNARAGEPFNITTGADNNGDSIFNDRPTYASASSDPANVVHTSYGDLNLKPQPGERIVPINLGHSAGPFVSVQMQASKTWKFGSRRLPSGADGKSNLRRDPRYDLNLSVEGQNITNTVSPAPPVGVLSSPFFGKSIATSNNFLATSAANRTFAAHLSLSF